MHTAIVESLQQEKKVIFVGSLFVLQEQVFLPVPVAAESLRDIHRAQWLKSKVRCSGCPNVLSS